MEKVKVDISTSTILKIIGIILVIWLIWKIQDIILILFIVFIITAALSPTVDWLSTKKVPRILAVISIYLLALLVLGGAGYLIIPPFVVQIKELIQNMPEIIAKIAPSISLVQHYYQEQQSLISLFQKPLEALSGQVTQLSIGIFSTAQGFFIGLGIALSIFVMTFYLLLEEEGLKHLIKSFSPEQYREQIVDVLQKVRIKWGSWVRGQLILCAIIGVVYYLGLLALGVPFALALAVLAGILEIIPYVGPIVAAIPTIIIAFFVSPWLALAVAIFYIIVQQLEGHILVPKIMQKAVGISPVTIIIALLIGAKLAGVLGLLLAVPICAGIIVLTSEWKNSSNQNEKTV